ncbi:MAG: sodium/glutamate symporter [Leptonema sp. (in: bacteria)]
MPFPFEVVFVFSYISLFLVIGTILRGSISFLQKYFIPPSLIGGLLGMLTLFTLQNFSIIDSINPFLNLKYEFFESFAYHFFNLSFIAIGLLPKETASIKKKGSLWMALIQGVSFPLQAFIGGILVIFLNFFYYDLHPTFGLFLPLGFTEGPGQALSIGKVWESFGFRHAATIGLSFATLGYFFSFFIGIPFVNWAIKKKLVKETFPISKETLKGFYDKNSFELIPFPNTFHSSSIEPLAFQFSLMGLIYLITFVLITILGIFVPEDVKKILWGFFFLIGLVVSIVLRNILEKLNKGYLINPILQRKLTTFFVDYLIVSTIIAIQPIVVMQFLIPILFIAIIGAITTFFVVFYFGKRLQEYSIERMVAIFGVVTGTTSTGLLLLRMVDPELKTPVAKEIGIMNLFSIPIIGLFLIFINSYYWWKLSLFTISLIYFSLAWVFVFFLYIYFRSDK